MKRWLVVVLVLLALNGCGTLNTEKYYLPTVVDTSIKSMPWTDYGVAFLAETMCIYVEEGYSRDIKSYMAGPLGLPIVPVGWTHDNFRDKENFDLVIWLFPEIRVNGFTVDPSKLTIQFDGGETITPSEIQLSRFTTSLGNDRGFYWFHPDIVEEILPPTDIWLAKPTKDFTELVELWQWTRLIVKFSKPSESSKPVRLFITGISKEGKSLNVAPVNFSFVNINSYHIGTLYRHLRGYWPDKGCRQLQAVKWNQNPQ